MAPGRPGESAVFSHTDPFAHDRAEHADEQGNGNGEELQRYPTAEAAGVRSSNPFAAHRNESAAERNAGPSYETAEAAGVRSHNPWEPEESSALNPLETPVSPTYGADTNKFESKPSEAGLSVYEDAPEEAPESAASPGTRLHNTDPFDHATKDQTNGGAAQQTGSQPAESGDYTDHAERGTALYQTVTSSGPQAADSAESPSGSSDRSREHGPGHIGFAEKDTIEQEPTHDDDDSPDHLIDKVKTKVKDKFHLESFTTAGPLRAFNPTSARMRVRFGDNSGESADFPGRRMSEGTVLWRSRDNRKGRNSIVVPRASMAYPNLPQKNRPIYTSSFKGVQRNLYRMVFTFPYWDMAFWSGWSYTWGSVLFVMDGAWAWIPYAYPHVPIKWATDYAVGIAFFVGALLYQVGATMAYLEAVNDGSFHGSAMRRFLEGQQDEQKRMLDEKVGHFFRHINPHHSRMEKAEAEYDERAGSVDPEHGWKHIHRPTERRGSIYPPGKNPGPRRGGVDLGEAEEGESHEYLTWRWWPTWHALRTHHIYEIGYIACSIQLFGATMYSWCGLVALLEIWYTLTDAQTYGAYYFPEIGGSICFVSASAFFLVETQEKWWKPMPHVVGWWIGCWAMVGSIGFLLNGLFGVAAVATGQHWCDYQSELSSTWGSFGYLLSALFQWYEAVNKHPIEEMINEPGEMKSFEVHLP